MPAIREAQLDLFGDQTVGPAVASPRLHALARVLPAELRLGTSSWSFPGWRGLVWDRAAPRSTLARAGLGAYASHPLLRAVGIDRTWHAPIGAAALAGYAAQVPGGFRFLVKAHRLCTAPVDDSGAPNPLWLDAEHATASIVAPFVAGLGRRAGVLLFQFPPLAAARFGGAGRFADALGEFLAALPRGPLYAVELRTPGLFSGRYVQALAAAGARHCHTVHPAMPPISEQLAALPPGDGPLVVRWNLRAGLAYETARVRYHPFARIVDPDPGSREAIAAACARVLALRLPAFVIANNRAEGSAPLTLAALAEAVATRIAARTARNPRRPPGS